MECPQYSTRLEALGFLVSIRLIHPVLTTYASKPTKIYLIKFYINQAMFCIASSRPSLIPRIYYKYNLCFYKLLVVLIYYWSLWVTSIKLLSRCKVISTRITAILTWSRRSSSDPRETTAILIDLQLIPAGSRQSSPDPVDFHLIPVGSPRSSTDSVDLHLILP